ncbi:MAG TPA: hypothetical protein VFP55_13675 [Solirubrobacteraceae bacterium]|nr:hypothetical protein [Solirubrobacteraceae bacterium]
MGGVAILVGTLIIIVAVTMMAPGEVTVLKAPKAPSIGTLFAVLAGLVLLVVVLYIAAPAFNGYHVGYNVMTDHECLSRVVQWCR